MEYLEICYVFSDFAEYCDNWKVEDLWIPYTHASIWGDLSLKYALNQLSRLGLYAILYQWVCILSSSSSTPFSPWPRISLRAHTATTLGVINNPPSMETKPHEPQVLIAKMHPVNYILFKSDRISCLSVGAWKFVLSIKVLVLLIKKTKAGKVHFNTFLKPLSQH